jgi:hypothetical protein
VADHEAWLGPVRRFVDMFGKDAGRRARWFAVGSLLCLSLSISGCKSLKACLDYDSDWPLWRKALFVTGPGH